MTDTAQKNACELLDADHIAAKHLFVEYARLATAPDRAAHEADRTALAMRICDDLTLHAQLEEEIFYPALRDASPDAAALLDEAQAEHQEARQMIAQLKAMGRADPAMDDLVAGLNRAIEHHVKEERDELFPKARSSGLDLDALGARLRERQLELQGEAAPA